EFDGCGRTAAFRIAGIQIHEARGAEGGTGGWVESVENVLSIEGTGRSTGVNAVTVVYGRPVVAARYGQAPGVSNRQGIGGVDAPRLRKPVQVHARIDRRVVLLRRTIRERVDGSDGVVGIDVPELGGLLKG